MIGEDITLDHTLGASTYLCAACSCQVKEENPGLDMLMAVKWEDHMLGSLIIEDRVLPPLEGIAEMIKADSVAPTEEQNQEAGATHDNPEDLSSIPIALVVTLSAVAILVFLTSLRVRKPT